MKDHVKEARNQLPGFWVGMLANAMVRVLKTKTLTDAKHEARDSLDELTDSHSGLHAIDHDIRRRWREAALGRDEHE